MIMAFFLLFISQSISFISIEGLLRVLVRYQLILFAILGIQLRQLLSYGSNAPRAVVQLVSIFLLKLLVRDRIHQEEQTDRNICVNLDISQSVV